MNKTVLFLKSYFLNHTSPHRVSRDAGRMRQLDRGG